MKPENYKKGCAGLQRGILTNATASRIYNKLSGGYTTSLDPFGEAISSTEEMTVCRQSPVQTSYHSSSQGYEVAPLAANVFP